MLKKITALGLILVLALSVFCIPVNADEDAITYLYTRKCGSNLTITSLNATCTSSLDGYYGTTTKIEVTQTLQVKNGAQWRKCEAWESTFNNYYCTFTNNRTVYSGNQYRVKSEFKVYSGSSYETITDYSDPVWT